MTTPAQIHDQLQTAAEEAYAHGDVSINTLRSFGLGETTAKRIVGLKPGNVRLRSLLKCAPALGYHVHVDTDLVLCRLRQAFKDESILLADLLNVGIPAYAARAMLRNTPGDDINMEHIISAAGLVYEPVELQHKAGLPR